jgi:polysaccharide deacetylase family protein (PEP-CTERM system associated)
LGVVAERQPELIKSIFAREHEIASHGYSHTMLYELSPQEFEQEIVKSVDLLTSITGERPVGFRAPSFSLNNSTRWALPILQKHGFKYDASVFPIKTSLYGVPRAPLHPYKPSLEDVTQESQDGNIVEFPMTVFKMGINIPVAGGFYLRVLPYWFLKFALKRIAQTRPVIIYIHPWETYRRTPRLSNMPYFSRFVTYHGINKALGKLEGLLSEFRFNPIREVLAEQGLI